jgi:CheY-like chemotaxis protein
MEPEYEVLIVDDHPADIRLLEIALREVDPAIRVRSVTDGEKALDYMFRRGPYKLAPTPDLVLLDLNLPKMDGHEVLRVLKRNDETRFVPVVVLTSSLAPSDVDAAFSAGANSYVVKRYDVDATVESMRTLARVWLYGSRCPA